MALIIPDFDRYVPDRTLPTNGGGKHGCEIFDSRGSQKRDSELLIGVLHGWLGAGTMRYVANAAREQGHTVFVVNHAKTHNQGRSVAVHEATKAAVEETKIEDVFYIAHSLAARDIVSAAIYQQKNEDPTYTIRRLATTDGLGTNGKNINLVRAAREVQGFTNLLRKSPRTYAEIVGHSTLNLLRKPFGHAIEGVSTFGYDATNDIAEIRKVGIIVTNDFHVNDFVVPPPQDNRGDIHEGSHLSFLVQRDTIEHIVSRLA